MPARSRGGTRSMQWLLNDSFFTAPAGGWRKHNNQSVQSHAVLPVLMFIGMLAFGGFVYLQVLTPALFGAGKWSQFTNFMDALAAQQKPAAVVPAPVMTDKGVDVVYNPPFALSELDSQQRKIFDLLDEIPNNPASHGLDLLGLAPLGFDSNTREVWRALGGTEASLRQYNSDGSVITSETGCEGATQGCDLNICPQSMWEQLYTNIWCGAAAFKEQLRIWDGVFTYAVAGYKGAWLYALDPSGNHLLDQNGNWIISRDASGKPKIDPDKQAQVDSVFNTLTIVPRH